MRLIKVQPLVHLVVAGNSRRGLLFRATYGEGLVPPGLYGSHEGLLRIPKTPGQWGSGEGKEIT